MDNTINGHATEAPPGSLHSVVGARWDIDPATGEAREYRLIAKEEIDGSQWSFPRGMRLRGFKDYRDGDWCVYPPGEYGVAKLYGVPESLLTIVRVVKRPNADIIDRAGEGGRA